MVRISNEFPDGDTPSWLHDTQVRSLSYPMLRCVSKKVQFGTFPLDHLLAQRTFTPSGCQRRNWEDTFMPSSPRAPSNSIGTLIPKNQLACCFSTWAETVGLLKCVGLRRVTFGRKKDVPQVLCGTLLGLLAAPAGAPKRGGGVTEIFSVLVLVSLSEVGLLGWYKKRSLYSALHLVEWQLAFGLP